MRNSLFLPIAMLFIAFLSMGFQCSEEIIDYEFNFVEKINISPTQKSYKLGDTIWLSYTNSNRMLFDKRTNRSIAADSASISFQVSFNSRYNAPVNPSDGFCDFVTSNGVNAGRYLGIYGSGILLTFGCKTNNNYNFTIGVVPTHKGIYSLDLSDSPRDIFGCMNRSSNFPVSTIEYLFNVADGNKDVYLTIPPEDRRSTDKNYVQNKIDNKLVYVVKVE